MTYLADFQSIHDGILTVSPRFLLDPQDPGGLVPGVGEVVAIGDEEGHLCKGVVRAVVGDLLDVWVDESTWTPSGFVVDWRVPSAR